MNDFVGMYGVIYEVLEQEIAAYPSMLWPHFKMFVLISKQSCCKFAGSICSAKFY